MKINLIYTSILILILLPFATAGLTDFFDKMTGKATNQPVNLEVSVGGGNAPVITLYDNLMTDVSSGLNEGPLLTSVQMTFSASDSEGRGNINDSTAYLKFTKSGEATRQTGCSLIGGETTTNSANYTCTVDMYWWDAPGTWTINASISDINNNPSSNTTRTFSVGATAGFTSAPNSLTWNTINPGQSNQEANEFITLNNTGNLDRNIQFNATNLKGTTDNTKALYAENFSANTLAGCEGTPLAHLSFQQIIGASLQRGNYTLSDGTGQENIFICLEAANSDLTQQTYSTTEEGAWTLNIAA
ncbi:MAG: hypothetical protein PF542_00945 [Nanoarchaeota archaeon]|jgi:hypothetical protein|nr:hypothetical protein [Nanoarchaeota archaeon]